MTTAAFSQSPDSIRPRSAGRPTGPDEIWFQTVVMQVAINRKQGQDTDA